MLLALRMKLARTLYEFMTYAPRLPVAITYNIDGRELPENIETNERLQLIAQDRPLFDADAARVSIGDYRSTPSERWCTVPFSPPICGVSWRWRS